jgi:5-methylcytosine-specific restriction endonuclease McrA
MKELASEGKRCPKCETWKPYSEYQRNRRNPDGYQSRCRPCTNATNDAWRSAHLTERRASQRAYQRAYAAANPDAQKRRQKDWYDRTGAAYARKYYAANVEKLRARVQKWWHDHPEYNRAWQSTYRTKKAGNGGSHTEEEWQALCLTYGNLCLRCGRRPKVLTRDHIVPVSLGGGNEISNIQPLCRPCNSAKNQQTTDYRRELEAPD